MVITRPISSGNQLLPCKSTRRKGPKPSRTSATKKLSALSAICGPLGAADGGNLRVALFEIGQRQAPDSIRPVKGAPNVVGLPSIVGTPV
jgi:hypothetical protein